MTGAAAEDYQIRATMEARPARTATFAELGLPEPADPTPTFTTAQVADMIATAVEAAVTAQADQATTTTIRAAALNAITPTDTA